VVTLASQIALARLLLPADFGLAVVAIAVTGFGVLFTDLGLAAAVVQRAKLDDSLLATAFWLNALSGLLLTLLVAALAQPLATFFGQPEVAPLLVLGGLTFTVSTAAVHIGLMQRAMRFKTLGIAELVAALIGQITTVVLAVLGAGAYCLVIGPVVQGVILTLTLWGLVRWLPRTRPTRAAARTLWDFGGGLTGANILYYISRNIDNLLLGKFAPVGDVGLYGRSYNLMMMPLSQVTSVLTRVLFPAFVAVSADPPRFRRAWDASLRYSLLLGLPVGLGTAVSAHALVETLYGERWLGMVPVLALLAASVPAQLVGRNLGPVYQALGRTGQQFHQALVTTGLTVLAVVVGLQWGITGVAAALLIKSLLGLWIPLRPALVLLGIPWRSFGRSVGRLLCAAALMVSSALGAMLWGDHLDWPAPIVLTAQVIVGGSAWFAGLWWLERRLLRETVQRVLRKRGTAK
jgi:O-antigen/teichoic acid export membrane protein